MTIGNASIDYVNSFFAHQGVVNGDISTVGNSLTLTLDEINVKIVMTSTSTTSCQIQYSSISGTVSPVDIRRCTIYAGSGVETYTLDGGSLTTTSTMIDDTIYTNSNDTSAHFIRVNNIIYIITVWISGGGASVNDI